MGVELKAYCISMHAMQCRVIVDNKCDFRHSSSRGNCTFHARLVSQARKDKQTTALRFCQEEDRSPKDTVGTCGLIVTLKLCQLILVQSSASVLVVLVYQHSSTMSF